MQTSIWSGHDTISVVKLLKLHWSICLIVQKCSEEQFTSARLSAWLLSPTSAQTAGLTSSLITGPPALPGGPLIARNIWESLSPPPAIFWAGYLYPGISPTQRFVRQKKATCILVQEIAAYCHVSTTSILYRENKKKRGEIFLPLSLPYRKQKRKSFSFRA